MPRSGRKVTLMLALITLLMLAVFTGLVIYVFSADSDDTRE